MQSEKDIDFLLHEPGKRQKLTMLLRSHSGVTAESEVNLNKSFNAGYSEQAFSKCMGEKNGKSCFPNSSQAFPDFNDMSKIKFAQMLCKTLSMPRH